MKTRLLYILVLLFPINGYAKTTHPSCPIILEHINNDDFNPIEVPLEDIKMDFDGDGQIDPIIKQGLGSSHSTSLGYLNKNEIFVSFSTCGGCASATTDDIKILNIENKLYGLNKEKKKWAFSYPLFTEKKPMLCSFEDKYEPVLKSGHAICHNFKNKEYENFNFEKIKQKSGFDWDNSLNNGEDHKNFHPAQFIETHPNKIDLNNDGITEYISKVWIVWMGGRYADKYVIFEINNFENREYDTNSLINNILNSLYKALPFKMAPHYYFQIEPIIFNEETFISAYSEFHQFWNIYKISNNATQSICEFDLKRTYNLRNSD